MKNKILFVFLVFFCACKENKKEEKSFILSIGDLVMYQKAELEQKEIGICPKGEVLEILEEVTFRNDIDHNFEIFYKVNCRGLEGFVSFEENKIEIHPERDFLIKNRQYIYDYFEFSEIITGHYFSKAVSIEFFGNIDHSNEDPKIILTNVVVNPIYGELLNLVKIKEKQFLLFNYKNIFVVSKKGERIYIEVIRGNDDFLKLDKKEFIKAGVPDYPDVGE